jgi:ribosomal protein L1
MAQAPKKKTPGYTKRMAVSHVGIDSRKLHTLDEAVKLIKARANAKFDETIEIAMNLGVDPRTPTRWSAASSTCRTAPAAPLRVAVFARGAKADEAKRCRRRHRRRRGSGETVRAARSISIAASPRRT